MKKIIRIALILLSISFLSCQSEENLDMTWSTEEKGILLQSCIESSTKEVKQTEADCNCFVNKIFKKTKNSVEFEEISIDELTKIKNDCENLNKTK